MLVIGYYLEAAVFAVARKLASLFRLLLRPEELENAVAALIAAGRAERVRLGRTPAVLSRRSRRLSAGRHKVRQPAIPPGPIGITHVAAALAQSIPASVLDVHPRTTVVARESNLHLGGIGAIPADVP